MDEIMQPEKKKKLDTNVKIILFCVIALIIFLGGAMIFMFKYLHELHDSPFVVGARKTSMLNDGANVQCSCFVEGSTNYGFSFNTTDIYSNKPKEQTYPIMEIPNNFSFN